MSKNQTPVVMTFPGSWAGVHKQILGDYGVEVIEIHSLEQGKANYRYATHILLQGGVDVLPGWYKQRRTYAVGGNERRDRAELAMAWSAMKHGKPLLGICRGHQMVAVAAGGLLVQDIKAGLGFDHKATEHAIHTSSNSLLRSVMGKKAVVNSYHHQAVFAAPQGLRVTAKTKDGIIEGLEGRNVLTVQWHPEAMLDNESFAIYETFLAMTK